MDGYDMALSALVRHGIGALDIGFGTDFVDWTGLDRIELTGWMLDVVTVTFPSRNYEYIDP